MPVSPPFHLSCALRQAARHPSVRPQRDAWEYRLPRLQSRRVRHARHATAQHAIARHMSKVRRAIAGPAPRSVTEHDRNGTERSGGTESLSWRSVPWHSEVRLRPITYKKKIKRVHNRYELNYQMVPAEPRIATTHQSPQYATVSAPITAKKSPAPAQASAPASPPVPAQTPIALNYQ